MEGDGGERYTPADFSAYGLVDILRADGAYVGTITDAVLPAAVSKTGRAAFIERDDLGVERVTVKRLPAAWQQRGIPGPRTPQR